jgi:hypothetical protein
VFEIVVRLDEMESGTQESRRTSGWENTLEFMERLIRARAVAPPLKPGERELSSQERREWWEFCVWMTEFLGNVLTDGSVDRHQAAQVGELHWLMMIGTYLFPMKDSALSGEQKRFVELCVVVADAFAVIVDDVTELQHTSKQVYCIDNSKLGALLKALVSENWLRGWKQWKHALSPIGWVHEVAERIHNEEDCPRAMDEETDEKRGLLEMRSLDVPTTTGDTRAALLRDLQSLDVDEIHATTDLDMACDRESLAPETAQLARSRYDGLPYSVVAKILELSPNEMRIAKTELRAANPALQRRLSAYQRKT